jgi:hypothetical protein
VGRAFIVLMSVAGAGMAAQTPDPFAFYAPVLELSRADRADLAAGRAIVTMLPHGERELAMFSAVRADVGGEHLAAWIRAIEDLKRSLHVLYRALLSRLWQRDVTGDDREGI